MTTPDKQERMRWIGYIIIGLAIISIILLSVVKAQFDEQSSFLCSEIESNPDLTMEECPAHQNNTDWFIFALFGLSFLLLAAGLILIILPLFKLSPRKQVKVNTLGPEEKAIFTYLQEHQGSAYQSDLVKHTGFSKVKITRISDRMEQKGILEKRRRGMANLIVLK